MKIETRDYRHVTILDLHGPLTIGEGDVALRQAVVEALHEGHTKILINMGDVSRVDSSGLGELVRCKTTAARENGEVKLLNLNTSAYDLLMMSSLIGVFETFDDEAEAIPSFWGEGEAPPEE